MRKLIHALAAATLLFATASAAQEARPEMDRAERALRDSMAPAGVAVDRVAPDEIRLRMPSDITFDFNRAEIRPEFLPRVGDLARTLNAHGGLGVVIIGHTDAIGPDSYNQALSERRAQSVALALLRYGVSGRRIETAGMGELSPIAPNTSEWGRAQNRRVEIRLRAKDRG